MELKTQAALVEAVELLLVHADDPATVTLSAVYRSARKALRYLRDDERQSGDSLLPVAASIGVQLSHHAQAILAILQTSPRASSHRLAKITARYGARLHDLRRAGYLIATERRDDGFYDYRLLQPERVAGKR